MNAPRYRRRLCLFALALSVVVMGGCQGGDYLWYVFGGLDKQKEVKVKPEYQGLKGERTAILVAADENLYYFYPEAPAAIGKAVAAKLKQQVKDIKLVAPSEVDRFQKQNPYWNTLPYREVVDRLKVERLVFIDVAEYGVHEPGNAEVWQGKIDATVNVFKKDDDDPVYATEVRAQFPPFSEDPMGKVNSNDRDIQVGLLKLFALHVSGLFNKDGATVPK